MLNYTLNGLSKYHLRMMLCFNETDCSLTSMNHQSRQVGSYCHNTPCTQLLKMNSISIQVQKEASRQDENSRNTMADAGFGSLVLHLVFNEFLVRKLPHEHGIADAHQGAKHEADSHAFLCDSRSQWAHLADGGKLPEGEETKRAQACANVSQACCIDEGFLESFGLC